MEVIANIMSTAYEMMITEALLNIYGSEELEGVNYNIRHIIAWMLERAKREKDPNPFETYSPEDAKFKHQVTMALLETTRFSDFAEAVSEYWFSTAHVEKTDDGEVFVKIPQKVLETLGWEEGDNLSIEIGPNYEIRISRGWKK